MTIVTGYHACSRQFADSLRSGDCRREDWRPSENLYDWLGDGIYFWEGSKERAKRWALEMVGCEADVIEADIDLGLCFDLMDTEYLELLRETYDSLVELYRDEGWVFPDNVELFGTGPAGRRRRWYANILDNCNSRLYPWLTGKAFHRVRDCKLRKLDRLVINQFIDLMEKGYDDIALNFQTVRGAFEEGVPVYPGSMIRNQTHIQIAVRDKQCILDLR